MHAAKHVLRYIKGTLDYGICYSASLPKSPSNAHLLGFSDSSHAADPDDRKSHSGYIYFMFNGTIIWSSSKQSVVMLSSMEAEYIELTDAAKEAIFLRKLLTSLNMDINDRTMILNQHSIMSRIMSNTPVLSTLIW